MRIRYSLAVVLFFKVFVEPVSEGQAWGRALNFLSNMRVSAEHVPCFVVGEASNSDSSSTPGQRLWVLIRAGHGHVTPLPENRGVPRLRAAVERPAAAVHRPPGPAPGASRV